MLVQGIVQGPPSQSLPDGMSPIALTQGKLGELIVSEIGGKYATQCYRGNMYDYATPLGGVTLTTTGSTTQTFGILNPAGSNKLIVPTKARVGFVGATGTVTALAWCSEAGLGTGVAGTSPLQTATFVTGVNSRTDILGNSTVGKIVSTCLLTTAPTIKRYFGAGWGAPLATTAVVFPMMVDDFDGDTIVGPGSMFFLAGVTAPGGATNISLTWLELPI
jgi:hypothetical protein